jgi:hypothetical protein
MSRNIDSLRDMAIAARRALGYIENVSKSDFEQDLEKQDSMYSRNHYQERLRSSIHCFPHPIAVG